MAASLSSSSLSPASSPSSSSSSVTSGAHRRRLTDVERDAAATDYCVGAVPSCTGTGSDDDDGEAGSARRGHGHGAGVKALSFFARRNGKRVPVVDRAWVRNAVACLLGVAVVVGLAMSSHRGDVGVGRLVRRVDAGDAQVLGWREENLTAFARRPPDPPSTIPW
nr:unnamed protein product [Digitaria exilis]